MGFVGIEQEGEYKIFSTWYKKYWEIGFKTRLYDRLSPEAYCDSLRRTAEAVRFPGNGWLLDAGCGSGLLLSFLENRLQQGGRYLGMDILPAGLASLKLRANQLNLKDSVAGVQTDLSRDLPLGDASVSCVAAHFSIYTLPEEKDRRQAYQEFWRVLKPGGVLVTANPTHSYNAEQIIRSSLEQLQSKGKSWIFKKHVIYPLTLQLGLKHIERQLKSGKWYGYQPGELQDDVVQAGFFIEHSESVYAGNGFLVIGKKL